jgi:hypothetical protein
MTAPSWLSLLSPLPADALPQRRPVASAEQIDTGTAGPIAAWQSVIIDLSAPGEGSRHVLITLDEHGDLLAGSDHVMFVRQTTPDGAVMLTEHHSIGGRFEADGSFRGTHWISILENRAGEEESATRSAEHRPPTEDEIAALTNLLKEILRRERR